MKTNKGRFAEPEIKSSYDSDDDDILHEFIFRFLKISLNIVASQGPLPIQHWHLQRGYQRVAEKGRQDETN